MRRWLRPSLPRLLTLAATAWIAFWACAPVAMRPVPVGLDVDRSTELGVAGGVEFAAPDDTRPPAAADPWLENAGGQFHIGGQLSPRFYLDLVGGARLPTSANASGGAGLGLRGRISIVDEEAFFLGVDVGLGFPYLEAGLPLGWRLHDRLAIWTGPSFVVSPEIGARWPLGLTWRATDDWDLSLQTAALSPVGAFATPDYPSPRFPVFIQSQWRFGVNRGR